MTPTQALLDRLKLLLQGTDFVSNLLYRLIACFNLGLQNRQPEALVRYQKVTGVPDHLLCAGQQLVQRDSFRVFSLGQNLV